MKNNKNKLRLSQAMIFSCMIIFSLITFLLTPIYTFVASDIVTGVTILPDAIKIILNLLEISAFAFCYSLIIFSTVTSSKKKALSLCIIYISACFIRRAASLLVTLFVDGYIISTDVFSVLLYFILEVVQVFIVFIMARSVAKKHILASTGIKSSAVKDGGVIGIIGNRSFSFTGVYSRSNPFQNCALKAGALIAIIKIFTRIVYDIDYGAPQSLSDGLTMAIYYISDIFICVIFYVLSWLILSGLVKKHQQIIKDQQE